MPNTETVDPKQRNCCGSKEKSVLLMSGVNIDKSSQARPQTDRFGSEQENDLGDKEEEKRVTRKTGAEKSRCAWLCVDSMRPRCRKSSAEIDTSGLDSLKTDVSNSKRPKLRRNSERSKFEVSNAKRAGSRYAKL